MIAAGTFAAFLLAQSFTQRGYIETRALAYPQSASNDSGHIVGDALLRWEGILHRGPVAHDQQFSRRPHRHASPSRAHLGLRREWP